MDHPAMIITSTAGVPARCMHYGQVAGLHIKVVDTASSPAQQEVLDDREGRAAIPMHRQDAVPRWCPQDGRLWGEHSRAREADRRRVGIEPSACTRSRVLE
jgi:hypothetical protein